MAPAEIGREREQRHSGSQSTIARLDHWCDEATFVDWEQPGPELPDWQTSYRRLIADGQIAPLTHPSEAYQARAFPPPVEPAATSP